MCARYPGGLRARWWCRRWRTRRRDTSRSWSADRLRKVRRKLNPSGQHGNLCSSRHTGTPRSRLSRGWAAVGGFPTSEAEEDISSREASAAVRGEEAPWAEDGASASICTTGPDLWENLAGASTARGMWEPSLRGVEGWLRQEEDKLGDRRSSLRPKIKLSPSSPKAISRRIFNSISMPTI